MKAKMSKMTIILLSGLIFTGIYSSANGADWKLFYVSDSGYKYFYDKESLESPDKYLRKVWQKISKDIGKDETEDMLKLHVELNCKTKIYEVLSMIEYDGTKEMEISYQDYKGRAPTSDLPLESRIGALYDNLCP